MGLHREAFEGAVVAIDIQICFAHDAHNSFQNEDWVRPQPGHFSLAMGLHNWAANFTGVTRFGVPGMQTCNLS